MLGGLSILNKEIKPLVIFGAGASYDLVNPKHYEAFEDSDERPPRADDIFKTNNDFFAQIQNQFGRIRGLIGSVRGRMTNSDKNLEQVLDKIQTDGLFEEEIPYLKRYLAKLFFQISKHNAQYPGNNYDIFFRYMKEACTSCYVVNFNYDYLAQKAIEDRLGMRFSNIETYLGHPIKLFHVHGSVLWKYHNKHYEVQNYNNASIDFTYPAIVNPTESGKDFICPGDHIDALRGYLEREANAIIIIGWKGTEDHFNEKILSLIPQENIHRIIIVGGESEFNDSILSRIKLNKFNQMNLYYVQGFSSLLNYYTDFTMDPLREHCAGLLVNRKNTIEKFGNQAAPNKTLTGW